MLTTDLALRFDPVYEPISRRFLEHPEELADAFARAWFKLTHRDMGPIERYLGPEVPRRTLLWQDPIPPATHELARPTIAALKAQIPTRACRCPSSSRRRGRRRRRSAAATSAAAPTARASGLSRRGLGGQRSGRAGEGSGTLEDRLSIQGSFGKPVSLADLIVLGGCAAVEQAAKAGGVEGAVPFEPGRGDATQEQTDVDSFEALEPAADGFRNYLAEDHRLTAEYLLVDRANLLTLSAPEMTVLVGGLRVLGANSGGSTEGVLTETPGRLTNDFFVNLLDLGTTWSATAEDAGGSRRATAAARSSGSARASTSCSAQLRAACAGGGLRERRRAREVRARLRRGMGQGHEPRPLRPQLTRDLQAGRSPAGLDAGL